MVFEVPNGSDKTTITPMAKTVGIYINADDIKKASLINNLDAAIKAEELRELMLEQKEILLLKLFYQQKEISNYLKKLKTMDTLFDVYMF